MAETLEVDLEFKVDQSALSAAADAAVEPVERLKELAVEFADALRAGMENIDLDSIDASALEDAANALARLGDADLSEVTAAAEAVSEAASPAEIVAQALAGAAADAALLAENTEGIESEQATQLAEQFSAAAAAAAEMAANAGTVDSSGADQLSTAFGAAGDQAGELSAETLDIAAALIEAAVNSQGLAGALADAVAAAGEGEGAIDRMREGSHELGDSTEDVANKQSNHNELLLSGAALADQVQEAFSEIASSAEGALGPLQRGVDILGGWEKLLTASNAALGGVVLGEAAFVAVGRQFDELSNEVTQRTGVTGDVLREASAELSEVLGRSDEDAGLLAATFGDLRRDMGLTGDSLVDLTVQTADFLSATGGTAGDVRSLTQVVHQFGLDAADTARFQDQLVAVQDRYGGSVSTLLSQVRTAGPILKTLGFDEGQIAGLAGQLDQAGVGLQRLAPRLAKFAQDAAKDGKDAGVAFRDLIDDIRNAGTDAEANSLAFEVFGARVGPQFATAVRTGVVSLEELDAVLSSSGGAAKAKADELDDLGSVFNEMKNKVVAAMGPIGKAMGDDLAGALQQAEPLLDGFLDLIVAVSPALGTLGDVFGVIAPGLGAFGQALGLVADVVDLIPDPLLAMAGAYLFLSHVPFGAMGSAMASLASGVANFAKAAPMATQVALGLADATGPRFGGLGAALAGINPATVIAAGGLLLLVNVLQSRQQAAQEMRNKVDALSKSLGDVSAAAGEAAPKLDQLLSQGSKGKLVDDKDLAALDALGLKVSDVTAAVQRDLTTPGTSISQSIRQQMIDAAGGIQEFVRSSSDIPDALRDELVAYTSTEEGAKKLNDTVVNTGRINQEILPSMQKATEATKELADAADEAAAKTLDRLAATGDLTPEMRAQAVAAAGLKKESDGEAATLAQVNALLARQTIERHGLSAATDEQAVRLAGITRALEEQGQTEAQITAAKRGRQEVELTLLDALTRGAITDKDRVAAAAASSKEGADAVKEEIEAEQALLELRGRLEGPTRAQIDAQLLLLSAMDKSVPPLEAIGDAARRTGEPVLGLGEAYETLAATLEKLNPPLSEAPGLIGTVTSAMHDGKVSGDEYGAALEAAGGRADVADEAFARAAEGLRRSADAILEMAPSLADVFKQLSDTPEAGKPDERLQQFDEEAAAIQSLGALREQDLSARQSQVERAIALAQRQAQEGGAVVDTASLEGQLASIRSQREAISGETELSIQSVIDSKAKMGAALAEAPPGLEEIFAGVQSSIDEEAALIATTIELRAQGIDDAVKLAFEFPADERDAFIRELADSGPEARAALEKQAEEILKGREENKEKAKSAGDIFADENVTANENAFKRGQELAENLERGALTTLAESEMFDAIAAAIEGDPQALREALYRAGADAAPELTKGIEEGVIGSPVNPETIGSTMAPAVAEMAYQGSVGAAAWTSAVNENVIGSPINPEVIGGFMAPAAGELAVYGVTGAEAWRGSVAGAVMGSPIAPEVIGGFIAPANPALSGFGSADGGTYAGAAGTGIASNPVPASVASQLVGGLGGTMNSEGYSAGQSFSSGLASGISSYVGAVQAAAASVVAAAVQAARDQQASKSPSRVAMGIGRNFSEGLAIGIEEAGGLAADSARRVVAGVTAQRIAAQVDGVVTGGAGGPSTVALGDGPGVDRIVGALGRRQPVTRPRRRRPFGGGK